MSNLPPPDPRQSEIAISEARAALIRANDAKLKSEIANSRLSRFVGAILTLIFAAAGLLLGVTITIGIWNDPSVDISGKLLFWLLALPPIVGLACGAALGVALHERTHRLLRRFSRR